MLTTVTGREPRRVSPLRPPAAAACGCGFAALLFPVELTGWRSLAGGCYGVLCHGPGGSGGGSRGQRLTRPLRRLSWQFDYEAVANRLFEVASQPGTPSLNRKRLYKVIRK